MKKKNIFLKGFACTSLMVLFFALPVQAAALEVQTSDVITVIKNCIPQIAALVVILAAFVVFCVICRKYEKRKRKFFRAQALIVTLLAIVVVINQLCLGPVSTLLDVAVQVKEEASEESLKEAENLITGIGEEGIVLVKNDGMLPLSDDVKNLNVFGWAATNPCYGGTGSGAVDTSDCVTLLDGLKAGGYTLNETDRKSVV